MRTSDIGRNLPESWSLDFQTSDFQIYEKTLKPVDAEAVVHPLQVEVHLLEDGILGSVPVLLDSHGVDDGLHVQQVVRYGVPWLLDGSSRGTSDIRDGEASHLGGEGDEPAHESHLGGVVAREVGQPLGHVLVVAPTSSLGPVVFISNLRLMSIEETNLRP